MHHSGFRYPGAPFARSAPRVLPLPPGRSSIFEASVASRRSSSGLSSQKVMRFENRRNMSSEPRPLILDACNPPPSMVGAYRLSTGMVRPVTDEYAFISGSTVQNALSPAVAPGHEPHRPALPGRAAFGFRNPSLASAAWRMGGMFRSASVAGWARALPIPRSGGRFVPTLGME